MWPQRPARGPSCDPWPIDAEAGERRQQRGLPLPGRADARRSEQGRPGPIPGRDAARGFRGALGTTIAPALPHPEVVPAEGRQWKTSPGWDRSPAHSGALPGNLPGGLGTRMRQHPLGVSAVCPPAQDTWLWLPSGYFSDDLRERTCVKPEGGVPSGWPPSAGPVGGAGCCPKEPPTPPPRPPRCRRSEPDLLL